MNHEEICKLVLECREELVDHLLQDSVNSVHIKNIKNNLAVIEEWLKQTPAPALSTVSVAQRTPNKRVSMQAPGLASSKEDVQKIAFAMSKFDYVLFNNLYGLSLNQGEVFEMAAALLGVKTTTLRNYRDVFDHHVDQVRSKRAGWKKPLPPDYVEIMKDYDGLDEDDLGQVVTETLNKIRTDTELIVKVAYGFLFASRAAKSTSEIVVSGKRFELINAPYPKGIAYLVFAGFGNTLFKGAYPAVYAYRDFGKVFTVFGESVTHTPDKGWQLPLGKYKQIEDCFSEEDLELIKTYPHTYLSNHVYREYVIDQNAEGYGEYKIELAEEIVNNLKELTNIYAKLF